jgi:TPR repeat protein
MIKAPTPGKSAVSQPVFVVSSAPVKFAATPASVAPATIQAAAGADADASARAKLAVALQTTTMPVSISPPATRAIALSATPMGVSPPASERARRLCARGLVAMAAGDIASARLYLERAAEGGDIRALMVLGQSYDPATLARMGALGIKGDAGKARDYYAKALAAGMGAARERMAALEAD